jgi:hypothetical protein
MSIYRHYELSIQRYELCLFEMILISVNHITLLCSDASFTSGDSKTYDMYLLGSRTSVGPFPPFQPPYF